jgi:hypothetical protein
VIYGGLLGLLVLAVRNGIGSHTSENDVKGVGESLKVWHLGTTTTNQITDQRASQYIFLLEVIYVCLTSIMKASLAVTLLQWAQSKIHIFLLRAAIVIDALICVIVVEYLLVQCAPISYTWELVNPAKKGVCLPIKQHIALGMALSATTITLDMLFLFVPFFMLRGRGVHSRVKMCIYGIFGLGVVFVPQLNSLYT